MTEYADPTLPATPAALHPRLPRAHQRYLGLADVTTHLDAEAEPPTRVRLGPDAHETLWAYLHTPGAYRSGPLFGRRHAGVVEVTHAARGGYPGHAPALGHDPFALDPQYLLGWSDAVSHFGTTGIDWVGHWLIQPDNRSGNSFEHDAWLRQAHRQGLADSRHFLMVLGDDDGVLSCTPLLLVDGSAEALGFELQRD